MKNSKAGTSTGLFATAVAGAAVGAFGTAVVDRIYSGSRWSRALDNLKDVYYSTPPENEGSRERDNCIQDIQTLLTEAEENKDVPRRTMMNRVLGSGENARHHPAAVEQHTHAAVKTHAQASDIDATDSTKHVASPAGGGGIMEAGDSHDT